MYRLEARIDTFFRKLTLLICILSLPLTITWVASPTHPSDWLFSVCNCRLRSDVGLCKRKEENEIEFGCRLYEKKRFKLLIRFIDQMQLESQ